MKIKTISVTINLFKRKWNQTNYKRTYVKICRGTKTRYYVTPTATSLTRIEKIINNKREQVAIALDQSFINVMLFL